MEEEPPQSQQPDDPIGDTLRPGDQTGRYEPGRLMFNGRFRLIRSIGTGGMGEVWLAEELATNAQCALKLFSPDFLRARGFQAEAEAEAGQKLNHPNIVKTYAFLRDGEEGGIVMEYVDGIDLLRLPDQERRKCYDPDEILPWALQICAALQHAHTLEPEKIIHRDVKPHNVLRDKDTGDLKLGDFGISRIVQETILATCGTLVQEPGSGSSTQPTLGFTIGFASPEQLNQLSSGRVSDDVFSLGATLFWLLTGSHCYTHEQDAPNAAFTTVSERRKMRDLDAGKIPKHWDQTVAACLHPDPDKRPSSVAEVAQMLTGKIKSPKLPKRTSQSPKGLVAAFIVILIGILGFAAWYVPNQISNKAEQKKVMALTEKIEDAKSKGDFLTAHELLLPEEELRANPLYALKGEWKSLCDQSFDWRVVISPSNAQVEFANDASAVYENGVVSGLDIGRQNVIISQEGYETITISLPVGGLEPLPGEINLEKLLGTLSVNFTPVQEGIAWMVHPESPGGQAPISGTSPQVLSSLPVGDYTIQITRPDWPDYVKTVTVSGDKTVEVKRIFNEAILSVSSRQPGAEISVKPTGTDLEPRVIGTITNADGRVHSDPIPTGSYTVTGKLGDYKPQIRTVLLEENSPPVSFNWSLGKVLLSSNLPEALVYGSDGKALGKVEDVSGRLAFSSGQHTFRAELPGLEPVEVTFEIIEDDTVVAPEFSFDYSRIIITGSPENADVYEGQRRVGRGLPFTLPLRPSGGETKFRIESAGYESNENLMAVLTKGDVHLSVDLKQIPEGWFSLSNLPSDAEVTLYNSITNEEMERAKVSRGKWKSKYYAENTTGIIRITHPLYHSEEREMTISPGVEVNWEPEMKPSGYKYKLITSQPNSKVTIGPTTVGTTNREGVFESEWLKESTVNFSVSKSGYKSVGVTLKGDSGEVVQSRLIFFKETSSMSETFDADKDIEWTESSNGKRYITVEKSQPREWNFENGEKRYGKLVKIVDDYTNYIFEIESKSGYIQRLSSNLLSQQDQDLIESYTK